LHSHVVPVSTVDLRAREAPWPFAERNAAAIALHWEKRQSENPGFFNGTIHMLQSYELHGGHFRGRVFPTRFANFLYWRDHGCPDKSVRDCFGSALIRSNDGQYILGRQAPGHINTGMTYLPGGFIDQRDVDAEGRVDIAGSVAREMREEAGFDATDFAKSGGALLTFDENLLSIAIEFVSSANAEVLLAEGEAHVRTDSEGELEALVAIRTMTDLDALQVPAYARHLLQHVLTK
jgi:8-oxo-dGTP pyrophosphatase MutT (NUDIX family)